MPAFTTVSHAPTSPDATFAWIVDPANWTSFRGYGPLPGIAEATADGPLGLGVRVRVRNTDGSVHHERVVTFEPGRRYAVHMELGPPASRVLAALDETVVLEPAPGGGTRVTRTFLVTPRAWFTAPVAWLVGRVLLPRAVRRHDADVAAALRALTDPGTPR